MLFLNLGCASRGNPGGGPIDRIPPEIIYTFPKPDSTNVTELSIIKVYFSESIDETSIFNNIFISPPIKFISELESDTELFISFKDSLKKNQTYVVVIGAKVKDIRNNKLKSSYQLAFSTGDKIEKGSISGKVFGIGKNDSYSIFVFDLNPAIKKFDQVIPDYISQTGADNNYSVNYLKNGTYRLFAVNDQNNNLMIDASLEKLAIPYKDVKIDSANTAFKNLNFQPIKIDTVNPTLTFVRSINNTKLDLNFSEKIIINSLDQIVVTDSISSDSINVFATSESIEADNILEVYTSVMDSDNVYLCSAKNIFDKSGNDLSDTTLSFKARGYSKPDSFQIVAFTPKDSSLNEHPNSIIYLEFSNPINKEIFEKNFHVMYEDSTHINGIITYPSAFEIEYIPSTPFELNKFVNVSLQLNKLKNIWGDSLVDSLLIRSFKISDGKGYGEISGVVKLKGEQFLSTYVQAENYTKKTQSYSIWLNKESDYFIKNVPEGIYKMSSFLDLDSNKVFSPGNLSPFKFSEPFIIKDDTVKVRKRWESTGVDFAYPYVE